MRLISYIKDKIKATDFQKKGLIRNIPQSNLEQYQSIDDLPMWNFRRVLETSDIRYLYKLDSYIHLPEKKIPLEKWDDIFWSYIDAKGIDYNFKLRLELKAKLAILESDEVFNGKNNYTKIELTKQKLEDLKVKAKSNTNIYNDAILSKFMGFALQPRVHTVSQYIAFEKLLIESNNNGSN